MTDVEMVPAPPEGFVLADRRGAFNKHNGPYFRRPDGHHAFFALERHCNAIGLIHGGMLAGFLDGVLANAAARALGATALTMHLSIDFLGAGRAGQWVFGEADVIRATRDVAFAQGRAYAAEGDLARATGIFKLGERPR